MRQIHTWHQLQVFMFVESSSNLASIERTSGLLGSINNFGSPSIPPFSKATTEDKIKLEETNTMTVQARHLLLQTSGMHCQIIFRPFQLIRLLEELSNIYSCLLTGLTLTVVQNLARSNQLNVSHLVMQCQLLPLHSPEIPCCLAKGVPSERLRLVKVIHFA